uniref:Uncharacterized protein n=1 Tax=Anguilla anguilla TaxID=7936 RepID=A0A0E9XYC0_ANGAN
MQELSKCNFAVIVSLGYFCICVSTN